MGWNCCSDWRSKQDVIDEYEDRLRKSGYNVRIEGSWVYAEKDGKPADLIYLLANKCYGEWGYKAISVSSGPLSYNAPLWMVQKIHPLFENDRYYQGWFEKYPKRKLVLQGLVDKATPGLFEEVA